MSRQGESYLNWMKNQKPIEDLQDTILMHDVMRHLPREIKYKLYYDALIKTTYKYRGPRRRFNSFDENLIALTYLSIENNELKEQVKNLKAENISLTSQLMRLAFLTGLLAGKVEKYEKQIESLHKSMIEYIKDYCSLIVKNVGTYVKSNIYINIKNDEMDLLFLIL